MTKRITSSDVYEEFDALCRALHVINAERAQDMTGSYLTMSNESPNGTNADRRYHISGMINGSFVNFNFHGSRQTAETLRMMRWAGWIGRDAEKAIIDSYKKR